jgi:ATP-dependent DNA helicase RecG
MEKIRPEHGDEIRALIGQGMGLGLHWFPGELLIENLAAVLTGMANTQGGSIIIGVAPRSPQIIGLVDPAETIDRVFQAALLVEPPLVLPVPRICRVDGDQLLWVTVPAGLPQVYSLQGRYLGREGSLTHPLPARRLRRLLIERGLIQFETQVPSLASLEDLDQNKVTSYLQALNLPVEAPTEALLLHRGCLKRDEKNRLPAPTYAALLLFGKTPQEWLPGATILAARFSGPSMADRFIKQEISGTLPEQLNQAEAFVAAGMRRVVRLVGLTRQETSEYPLEAVRELLVNAVAHRDYNQQGDTIHLNIYSDRLEIHSPGGLPGPVNLQNLLEARFSRNAIIAQVLSDLGYVERLGYGLDRVVAAMERHHLAPPRFEEVAGSFRVTLFGEASEFSAPVPEMAVVEGMELNPRQERAVSFLLRNRRITNRDYQDLCPDVHAETLRRDLADLTSRGLVIKIGDKRATYYILKK